jgi:hypothetical protein
MDLIAPGASLTRESFDRDRGDTVEAIAVAAAATAGALFLHPQVG